MNNPLCFMGQLFHISTQNDSLKKIQISCTSLNKVIQVTNVQLFLIFKYVEELSLIYPAGLIVCVSILLWKTEQNPNKCYICTEKTTHIYLQPKKSEH